MARRLVLTELATAIFVENSTAVKPHPLAELELYSWIKAKNQDLTKA
ncbi:MAG: hypothetical protein F6K42_06180 [Leptolyngbya sp. SIO1D8]|nr:hypothetical protein [Leptolyngbya sp. SIO1D8]